ncbi:hypothetical protein LCM08_06185 [Salipiger pacificus]|nr:hypothetical protein [Alloyangia pacifica]
MTSSNFTRLSCIEEITPGVTPGAGNFMGMRWTGESLTGTPQTAQSEEARTDRASGGQVQTGLEVGGDWNFEVSTNATFKAWLRSVMKQSAYAAEVVTAAASLSVTAATGVIAGAGVDFTVFSVGDLVRLEGFGANNGKVVYVTAAASGSLTVAGKLVDEAGGAGRTVRRCEYVEVGADDVTFTIEKAFTKLADKSIVYRGARGDTLSLGFAYGEIATATIGIAATGYETPAALVTQGRTITDPGSTRALNASSDVGLVIQDGAKVGFPIQSLSLELQNNHEPDVNLGNVGPEDYTPGEASIGVTLSAYLKDANWDFMAKKLSQAPVQIAYYAQNEFGGLAVQIPEAQFTFPDPQAGGKNQKVTLELQGTAKAPTAGGSPLRIYWLPALA